MAVLILAPELDLTADHMVKALEHRDVPVIRLDTAWFPQRASIDAEFRNGTWTGTLHAANRQVHLVDVRAVWYRSPSAFDLPAGLSATERQWAMSEAKFGFGGVLSALRDVLWVNHPARNADATYKPVQLATAARCDLNVPETLITNRDQAVLRFAARGDTVAKALGAPSVLEQGTRKTAFTRLLDAADLADLRGIEITAHQFQRWVRKAYEARVVVVGAEVFAAGIFAGTAASRVDWRNDYSALRYELLVPPVSVVAGVLQYCVEFGLNYGAFDFVIEPSGEWVFLECNPAGQYSWLEEVVDVPITETLADLLAEGVPA